MGFSEDQVICGGGQGSQDAERPGPQSCRAETYSGYRLHERPRRFTWQGEWLEVRRVLRRWREPEDLCFTVAVKDSRRFLLKYHLPRDAWEALILTGFDTRTG